MGSEEEEGGFNTRERGEKERGSPDREARSSSHCLDRHCLDQWRETRPGLEWQAGVAGRDRNSEL